MGWQEGEVYDEEECGVERNVDEGQLDGAPSDQSFRESFFSSGDDWTSLYEVDEYGMPLTNQVDDEGLGFEKGEQFQSQVLDAEILVKVESSTEKIETGGPGVVYNSIVKTEYLENLDAHVGTSSSGKANTITTARKRSSKQPSSQLVSGKLVQTNLFGFLGIAPPKPEQTSSGKKLKQQDIRALFGVGVPSGIPPIVRNPAAEAVFMSKFKRPSPAVSNQIQGRKGRGKREFEGPEVVRKCPFYKRMPGTSFTVDAFKYGEVEGCSAYFLTHFHYDHYGGLTKAWSHGPIYCTPVTARLCVLCLYVDPRWICPLQIGLTHVIEGVEVRMLEANHCPGAALILFRFKSGNSILHTGDFRACKKMEEYPELLSSRISTVYLDTTYCDQRYRFPLQEEVIKFVIRQTCNALVRNKKTLVVVGSYSIGKERVYHSIAEALGVQVFADRQRRRILTSLDWPELASKLSTQPDDTFLHVLPLSNLNPPKLKAYLQTYSPKKYSAVLAFRPTGWTYTEKVGDKLDMIKPHCSGPVTIYGVPYSEHSSFTELREFIQFVRPGRIIPTVNVGKASERHKMQAYFDQWLA
ncbi:DNA cross-link repair 1A protein [Marchantia polymorpha subsp. ruderalis]|uniref:DNA repair metallo-beta-lactamase domain-containing protein n=2 Tax=Marchantia polymorpha TaxID=3197 RepID=A0AAF6BDU8_MARPO|nr:hypothetical protein MARPO_0175s0022 [Marchantia polymorpha]BBN10182.1 hypothetical protein Mp_5g01620 [Marchantia polymorpha subsp. ruderalis]|eukprot:PTQ28061.1 hypothetical protein MARPO_0175s0022 [Marchantia polymorpha]